MRCPPRTTRTRAAPSTTIPAAMGRYAALTTGDEVVREERIRDFIDQLAVGPAAKQLQQMWNRATKGYFLGFLPMAHNYEHVGQADLIRGILAHPGRF
jgi:hypothetical protein